MSDITRGTMREPTRAEEISTAGLRDEKRRQTRQHIAEVATGLFMAHGFAQVTIAEVARAAEVSVHTVYSYFPSKEDLVFYPGQMSAQRMVRMVRDRRPGVPAAAAVLAALRAELRGGPQTAAPAAGLGRFLDMVRAEPALAARLDATAREMVDALAAALAAETGAGSGDPMPRLVAAQLGWVQDQVFADVRARTRAGEPPEAVARGALALLDTVESLLGAPVLHYAPR